MNFDNEMTLIISSNSKNESLARVTVASFAAQLDPTLEQLSDIKVAVSEAVTNSIIHGYYMQKGEIYINCKISNDTIYIEIKDSGLGIKDIKEAMTPLYTSKPDNERSGMGFTVMETFMDQVSVKSELDKGTSVKMIKKISCS